MTTPTQGSGPLAGVRVVDLTRAAGPYATLMLAGFDQVLQGEGALRSMTGPVGAAHEARREGAVCGHLVTQLWFRQHRS